MFICFLLVICNHGFHYHIFIWHFIWYFIWHFVIFTAPHYSHSLQSLLLIIFSFSTSHSHSSFFAHLFFSSFLAIPQYSFYYTCFKDEEVSFLYDRVMQGDLWFHSPDLCNWILEMELDIYQRSACEIDTFFFFCSGLVLVLLRLTTTNVFLYHMSLVTKVRCRTLGCPEIWSGSLWDLSYPVLWSHSLQKILHQSSLCWLQF